MSKGFNKLKILTVLGTRPEIIRLARILPKLDQYFKHTIVYTGQSYDYELSDIFFKELELRKPDYRLQVKSETIGGQIANIMKQTEDIFIKVKPDALFILGDTNSTLCAITAKRFKIPIFHMEAGNRCFNWEVPEEVNRAIVDVISDYNLPYTEHGRRYLIQQGIHPSKIFVMGSPLREVYNYFSKKISSSQILKKLKLQTSKYFVVSMHREENVDNKLRLEDIIESLNEVAKTYKLPLVVTLHPRTKKQMSKTIRLDPLIKLYKPFGIIDYIMLQKNALCVLSDSGTIQEESSMLAYNAIQIRTNLERPEAFDKGVIILSGLSKNAILAAIEMTIKENSNNANQPIPEEYTYDNVSTKITKLILGLTSVSKYKH